MENYNGEFKNFSKEFFRKSNGNIFKKISQENAKSMLFNVKIHSPTRMQKSNF
jgi:hypothetical protein